jgi:ribosome-interacting GTPase 1
MPTNLPPEYAEAERLYKEATTPEEKIDRLEDLISTIPKHKGTDKLRADLRRRLSKLKNSAQAKKGTSKHESAFHIPKEGAGQIAVIGPANVGKSSLVGNFTNANPEISAAPFTTWTPTPGMMPVEDIQIQLIDTPAIDRDYIEPELVDLIRHADMLFLMVDLQADPIQQIHESSEFLAQHRIYPEHQSPDEQSIRIAVMPWTVLVNKCDDETGEDDYSAMLELMEDEWPSLPISALNGRNADEMKQAAFDTLQIIRIYSKSPGREPDLTAPFVMKHGSTVEEFARNIHQDFFEKLKSARVWGSSAFDGQQVQREFVLQDGDVVELRI